ncbi:DUF6473 family protein [Roseovarius sp. EGI FJ00037]|uniref:DUF6473 family protein n=1 Tax=Roseovarius TaxID=74030 RepID=UPI0022A8162D|nr:DUF6473 family protein [Roseovarius sp. EGI FJ00037]MCZ0814129.1 DUF6473 family protein [Roseovarius sp. EGI FJ00037]
MSSESRSGRGPLNYAHCRYAGSKLQFRGPARCLERDYVAVLGGTRTYGKFIRAPFPELMERRLGIPCVNLGCLNAGLDAPLNDDGLLRIASGARAVVLQMPGAINLSNRFYRVHPRRNDRLVEVLHRLRRLYPDVDFVDFHFTRHLLRHLHAVSPERFDLLREELRMTWVERIGALITRLERPVILFWFAARVPEAFCERVEPGTDPVLVNARMLRAVVPKAARLVEVKASAVAQRMGTSGMVFAPQEAQAARQLPGPVVHGEAAQVLTPALRDVLNLRKVG